MKLPRYFLDNFLNFLVKGYNYSEEGVYYSPEIMLTKSFDNISKTLVNDKKIHIKSGLRSGKDITSCLKPIIPFCENGWTIYIDITDKNIEYGIIRTFSGPCSICLTDNIFDFQNPIPDSSLLLFRYLSKTELLIKTLNSQKDICLSLSFLPIEQPFFETDKFIEDLCATVEEDKRKNIKKAMGNFLSFSLTKIHGTIVIIINDNGTNLQKKLLKDGIWLKEPIDLGSQIDNYNSESDRVEKFYALTGILTKMFDFDGVTVLDDKCRILAYNCFVKQGTNSNNKVAGGARKRAASTLWEHHHESVVGLFFKSHDGHSYYLNKEED